jgi:hypothetical protein
MIRESHGKTEELGKRPIPVPLCPPQIPHGMTRAWTRVSEIRCRRLTTWAIARSPGQLRLGTTTFHGRVLKSTACVVPKRPAAETRYRPTFQLRTRQYIPEDSELHTRRRENLKSHMTHGVFKSFWARQWTTLYVTSKESNVKQSRYTPWRSLGGEEV